MKMLKIVADDKIPFLRGVFEKYADIQYHDGASIDRKTVADCDALVVRTRTKCTKELLSGSGIKYIATATIGFDHIDTAYCNTNSITWTNAPGCNSASVNQYVVAALLKISRDFRLNLSEKTIGIIGVGNVGSKVAASAEALGMKVLLCDPPRERAGDTAGFTGFDTLAGKSDFISLHVPLNIVGEDKTYRMINEKSIKKIKKGAWLLNTSRGEVAETSALKKALDNGRLAGAVIDVWEHEPDLDHELMHRTFISTPHIAGYSTDGKANGTSMVVNDLARFFSLPLENWYPAGVPEPVQPEIEISCKGKTPFDIVGEAVERSYNIGEDDMRLRFSPSEFEKQRGAYPLRREFPAYSVKLSGAAGEAKKILKALGFRVS
jgi:erythronate-4-phosphate dehydrogenase